MSGERSTTRAAGGAAGGCRATPDVHITNPATAIISNTRAHAPMFMGCPHSSRILEPFHVVFRATRSAEGWPAIACLLGAHRRRRRDRPERCDLEAWSRLDRLLVGRFGRAGGSPRRGRARRERADDL